MGSILPWTYLFKLLVNWMLLAMRFVKYFLMVVDRDDITEPELSIFLSLIHMNVFFSFSGQAPHQLGETSIVFRFLKLIEFLYLVYLVLLSFANFFVSGVLRLALIRIITLIFAICVTFDMVFFFFDLFSLVDFHTKVGSKLLEDRL